MTTYVETHGGLARIVDGADALGRMVGPRIERMARHPALTKIATALATAVRRAREATIAAREARTLEEIESYDWRLAAEIRAARGRDNGTSGV